jgi:hypothetical protein
MSQSLATVFHAASLHRGRTAQLDSPRRNQKTFAAINHIRSCRRPNLADERRWAIAKWRGARTDFAGVTHGNQTAHIGKSQGKAVNCKPLSQCCGRITVAPEDLSECAVSYARAIIPTRRQAHFFPSGRLMRNYVVISRERQKLDKIFGKCQLLEHIRTFFVLSL